MEFKPSSRVWPWWKEESKHSQWSLIGSNIRRQVVLSPAGRDGSGDTYTVAIMELFFQRVSTYYSFVYIIPIVVASMLTVSTFILPPGNPQKLTLGECRVLSEGRVFGECRVWVSAEYG